ncbi:hypothetical protein [Xanthomonas sp. NCPPB 2632]|uniref:hypothetical protein n=1 Tax=Xanthomonas sp. NCPPB 2632 TaxID=3240912 RepID=UPI00351829D5
MRTYCLIAALAAISLTTQATAVASVTGTDILAQWQRIRIERLGSGQASLSRKDIAAHLQADPGSAYSAPADQPAFTNDIDWPAVLDAVADGHMDTTQALDVLRRDLGTTRARPRIDITPNAGYRDDFVSASASKAEVDPDIFWHMLDLTGYHHSTKAAIYAVGMQILRAQVVATPPEAWTASGVDPGVFTRVMRAQHSGQLSDYDLDYLSTIVQYRLIHPRVSDAAGAESRGLPVAYRVARTAAAYRDAQGYIGRAPCLRDASPDPRSAGTGGADDRPLCFVAATDRAVHAWYVDEYRRQTRQVPEPRESGLQRLARVAGLVLALIDLAGAMEFVEATVADELATADVIGSADADAMSESANLLACPL